MQVLGRPIPGLKQVPLQHWLLFSHTVPVARPHCPALDPVAQHIAGAVQVTAVPVQTPFVHTSLVVQGLPSSHVAPCPLGK